MPVSPAPNSVARVRPDIAGSLEEVSVQMNMAGMIALSVFPVFEALLQAGTFGKLTAASLIQAADTARANGGSYNTIGMDFEDDSYATKENGLIMPIDRRNARIYKNYFDIEVASAAITMNTVLTNMEQRVADIVMNTSTFTPVNAAAAWLSSGVPSSSAKVINDVEKAVQALYDRGIIANTMVMSFKQFRNLRNMPEVIDRIVSSGAGNPAKPSDVTPSMLSAVFDIPKILVGRAQKQNAKEGQTSSLATIWSDRYVSICRTASGPTAPIEEPCIGRTFHWGEDGSNIGGTIETWWDENLRSDKVRVRMETHEKLMLSTAGYLIDTTAAS